MANVSDTNRETTLQLYANPLLIQDKQLSLFEEHVFEGKSVLDGNNVFTFDLEMGATLTAGIVNEMISNFQSLYPSRASTMSDLYRHLSDYDYVDMFSTPASTTIELMFDRNFLIDNAPDDPNEDGSQRIIIPEFSTFTIGDYQFGIHYPIEIKIRKAYKKNGTTVDYDKCMFHCMWNTEIVNPLYRLNTNVLEHRMFNKEGLSFLCISVPIQQFVITTKKEDSVSSTGFIKRYSYNSKFYAIRVFHYWNNQWVEIAETLSDVIYNPQILTAKVKVLSDIHMIEVSIPQVYFTNGIVGNRIMCLIYTTEGALDIDIRNYRTDQFSASFLIDDTVIDDTYSAFLKRIPTLKVVALSSRISSGSNGKTFSEMKNRVINSVGGDDVLVVPKQLEAHLSDTGFKVSKYIDNITDRIYVASKEITDSNGSIVGSGEYMTTITSEILKGAGEEYDTVLPIDNNSFIVMPTSIFRYDSATDSMVVLSRYDKKKLLQDSTTEEMIEELNNNIYTFTPFHVKISTQSNLPMAGAFDLMNPTVSNVSFTNENRATSTQISMYGCVLLHDDNGCGGYTLTVSLYKTSDLNSVAVADGITENLAVILRTRSSDGTNLYLKGTYIGKSSDKKDLVEFHIGTSYKITEDDTIDTDVFTQINDLVSEPSINYINLDQTYELLFFAHKRYIADTDAITISNAESDIPRELIESGMVWLATQQMEIKLGESISSLRSNVFMTLTGKEYQSYDTTEYATYATDIYERYPEDVYEDGVIVHYKGELMLDENNRLIVKKYAGDLIITSSSPTISSGDQEDTTTSVSIGLKNPSFVIETISTGASGVQTSSYETLFLDSDLLSPTSESFNVWYPFRAYETTENTKTVWKILYTGNKSSCTVIKVSDMLKWMFSTVQRDEEDLILDTANERYRTYRYDETKKSYVLNEPIKGSVIYVKNDVDDVNKSSYWIYNKSKEGDTPEYVLEQPESRDTILSVIGKERWGALYQRDAEYSTFDYSLYVTENTLCLILKALDELGTYGSIYKTEKDIISAFDIDSTVLAKLKRFRDPWIKIIETKEDGFEDIVNYWNNRDYMNFNRSLGIRTHDERATVYGLEALAYLQERSINSNTIEQVNTIEEGSQIADNDTSKYRLVWVDQYIEENDKSYINSPNAPLIEAMDINTSRNEHVGALIWGSHNNDHKHYVVITGPSFIKCYNRLMTCPTMSGYLYEANIYDTSKFTTTPYSDLYPEYQVLCDRSGTPITGETELEAYANASGLIESCNLLDQMIAVQTNGKGIIDINFMTTLWSKYWPWEMENWLFIDGSTLLSRNMYLYIDPNNKDAKILHAAGDIIFDQNGKPAEADQNERKIIYHVDMIHCDYKVIESDDTTYSLYRYDIQNLLRGYFQLLEDTRPLLLERTNLYYSPIKSMGYGNFKGSNGEVVQYPLEITVDLRVHISPTTAGSDDSKELIRSNIITLIEQHIQNGNISCTSLADDIRDSMSDVILYVDVLGINGDPDVQTLVSEDASQSSVRLKSLLVLEDDNTISVEKGVNIEWSILQ